MSRSVKAITENGLVLHNGAPSSDEDNCSDDGDTTLQQQQRISSIRCRICKGRGFVTCYDCQGIGIIQSTDDDTLCTACSGAGYVDCSDC